MSEYIVEVSEADFAYQVLVRLEQVPVVDFWAPWCGPCRVLGPVLEKLAREAGGAFVLAKVNVDENPRLAARYGVRGIPNVKVFLNGQVAGGFVGAQPEERVRAFLRQFAPSQADLALEKGHSLLAEGAVAEAEAAFREALAERPEDPHARLGLAKALLRQGRAAEALPLLEHFPASKVYDEAQRLLPLARALLAAQQAPESSDDPLEAMYFRALRPIAVDNLPAAMDGLLEVLRRDKGYRDGEVHRVALGVLALMGEGTAEAKNWRWCCSKAALRKGMPCLGGLQAQPLRCSTKPRRALMPEKRARRLSHLLLALTGLLVYFLIALHFAHYQEVVLDEGAYLYKGWLFIKGIYQPFQDYGPWTNKMPLSFLSYGAVQWLFGPGLATDVIFLRTYAVAGSGVNWIETST